MEKTTPQIFYWLIETKIRNFIPPTPPVCLVSLQNLLRMRAHVTFLLLLSLYALYPYIYYLSIHYLCFKSKFLFFYIKNQKKRDIRYLSCNIEHVATISTIIIIHRSSKYRSEENQAGT